MLMEVGWGRCIGIVTLGILVQWAAILSSTQLHYSTNRVPDLPQIPVPQLNLTDRVVLCIIDGLGLEPALSDHYGGNYLRELVEEGRAQLGVARVRLPTETRPGHAAILGGVSSTPILC